MKEQAQGFTLYELLVTMTMAGMLIGIGVPGFQGMVAKQRNTSTINELSMSLNLARSEAVKRGKYVTVCKSTDGTSCTDDGGWEAGWIVFVNDGFVNLTTVGADDEVLRVHAAAPSSVTLVGTGGLANNVILRPTGAVGTTAGVQLGTLTICDKHQNADPRALLISATGRVRVSHDVDHLDQELACE